MPSAPKKMVELPPLPPSTVRERWGVAADTGWAATPNILMLGQAKLGLTSEQLNVTMNLLMHWHSRTRMPFPRTSTIAARMGVSERTVHRVMKSLLERGFIVKEKRKRYTAQSYDVTPLVYALQHLAEQRLLSGYQVALDADEETPPPAVQLVEVL